MKENLMNYPAPEGKNYFEYQKQGIDWITSRYHSMIADEMGLGKTIQAIGAINKLKCLKTIIICPAGVKLNWLRELNDWLLGDHNIFVVMKRNETIPPEATIIIVNYDLVSHSYIFHQLRKYEYAYGIVDEAHALKNPKAKRTKALLAANGILRRCVFTTMLTGTPVLNRPIELFPILSVFAKQTLGKYCSFVSFAYRYCGAWRSSFHFDTTGASNTQELGERLRATYMLRRSIKEVQKDLPEVMFKVHLLETPPDTKAKITQIIDVDEKTFRKRDLNGEHIATLRRETAKEKLDYAMAHIRNTIESVGKVVIFAYHKEVIDRLSQELSGYGVVKIDGRDSLVQREEAKLSFINNPAILVFIGQVDAAGQGIDGLQKATNHVLFIEWSWVPGMIEQAIKRVHRFGQKETVQVEFLVWADSVEEHMMKVALDKLKTIREIMG